MGIKKVFSEVLPQDKVYQVARLQKKGFFVSMVGDGVNDAPALVKSNLGIAMGNGTDVAIASSDIILIQNNLKAVIVSINLSKRIVKTIF